DACKVQLALLPSFNGVTVDDGVVWNFRCAFLITCTSKVPDRLVGYCRIRRMARNRFTFKQRKWDRVMQESKTGLHDVCKGQLVYCIDFSLFVTNTTLLTFVSSQI